jgi:S-formylglutathione hydrolase FrmB
MAFFRCDFYSETLRKSLSMNVILPDVEPTTKDGKYKTLYLLHGLGDDYTTWQRRTSIERYLYNKELAVVMLDGGRSFYTDMKNGGKFFTFLTEELPAKVQKYFPLSNLRENNFIAGNSMGGYGSIKAALRCPEKYAACGILSSVTDIPAKYNDEVLVSWMEEFSYIFGTKEEAIANGNDIFSLVEKLKDAEIKPGIMQICGTEDFLYNDNMKLKSTLEACNWPNYTYIEGPGVHSWDFWDANIEKIIEFILNLK